MFEQLALALKKELPWNFSLYWTRIFCHSGFLSNLRLPWNFSSPGRRPPSPTPRLVRLCVFWCHDQTLSGLKLLTSKRPVRRNAQPSDTSFTES